MKDKYALLENEINSLLDSSTSGILGASDQYRLAALRLELQKWVDHEIHSAILQSRLSSDLQGDENTKYFHAVASTRKNHNVIWGLEDEVGNFVTDDLGLKTLGIGISRIFFLMII